MPSALSLVVAINPTASFGRRQFVGPRVVERLRAAGHRVTPLTEHTFGQLRAEVERAVAAGTDALIVVGGDGMVSLGVNILAGTQLPLGIIPSGTGNDLARGLGIPLRDPAAATELLLRQLDVPPRRIDLGRVDGSTDDGAPFTTWFAGVLAAGFDSIVNERANQMSWPRGASRYTIALLRELAVLRPISYSLVIDGGAARPVSAVLLAVANNVSLGGGMRIAAGARLDDGVLDLVVVHPVSRLRFLRLFPSVFSGAHTRLPIVEIQGVTSVRIAATGVFGYADGERVGALPLQVTAVPGGLSVLAPAPGG